MPRPPTVRRRPNQLFGRLALAIGILAASATAWGRPVHLWSDAELWEKADVVVLGTIQSSQDVKVQPARPLKPEDWVTVESMFEVQRVLSGEWTGKTVTVEHRRFFGEEGKVLVLNGPSFVEFDPPARNQFLMFLKRVEVDGGEHFEPLTGQMDPDQSFRLVQPYHVSRQGRTRS